MLKTPPTYRIATEEYRRLIEAGVDAITLGDHIYRKREIIETLQTASNIVKPANFPKPHPVEPWCTVTTSSGIPWPSSVFSAGLHASRRLPAQRVDAGG